MHNGVARARLTPDEVQAAVDGGFRSLPRARRPVLLVDRSQTSPPDLDEALAAAGLQPSGNDWPGMALLLEDLTEDAASKEVTVEHVEDEPALEHWGRGFCAAFGVPTFAAESWIAAARRLEFRNLPWGHWIGRLRGATVGVGLSYESDGVVGLYAIGTVPEARRRVVGAALTVVPLLSARERGCRNGTRERGCRNGILHATEQGEPLYRRLGFVEYCKVSRFVAGV
jgi:GNAT superfamily N-acetyltransferase